jgi:hypothetical protein
MKRQRSRTTDGKNGGGEGEEEQGEGEGEEEEEEEAEGKESRYVASHWEMRAGSVESMQTAGADSIPVLRMWRQRAARARAKRR